MFRILFILLFSFAYIGAHAQGIQSTGNATDTAAIRGSFKVGVKLRLPSLPNTHALGVLTTDEKGIVKLDTLDAATGVSIEILTDTSDAIHSWVWSIVSNPTIDSYLYATRGRLQKVGDSINVNVALKKNISDSLPTTGYTTRARLQKVADSINAIIAALPTYSAGWGLTGSFAVDSQIVASRERLQKKVDSLIDWAENTFILTETDPVFLTYPAAGIGAGDIANWDNAYSNRITSLTTSGSSGAATLTSNTLNIPQYTAAGLGAVTSVGTGYGLSGGPITSTGTVSADTATLFQKYTTTLAAGSGVSISGRTISATGGGGTVTNVIGGTNISITGTSTIQPTVNITGTISVANGGTGTTSTTSVNTTPITYGANNTVTASALTLTTTTLNPTVVTSSLTSVGTIGAGTWSSAIGSAATGSTQAINNNSTQIATTAYADRYHPTDTTVSAAYTLTSRDFYRTIHCTNGSNIALTVPTGLGTTFICVVIQEGAGSVTPTASSTTLTMIPTATTKTKQVGSAIVIRSWATANTFTIQGDMN